MTADREVRAQAICEVLIGGGMTAADFRLLALACVDRAGVEPRTREEIRWLIEGDALHVDSPARSGDDDETTVIGISDLPMA